MTQNDFLQPHHTRSNSSFSYFSFRAIKPRRTVGYARAQVE
jgi:hypothetical protein